MKTGPDVRLPVLALGVVLLAGVAVSADTTVGGSITTDTHWTIAGSPYVVTEWLSVRDGASLWIDPGVEVRFDPMEVLLVQEGQLIARGTEGAPIVFTASASGPVTDADRWGYIGFEDRTIDASFDAQGNYAGGSIIEHAVVEYTGTSGFRGAIWITEAAPYISHNVIRYNARSGVWADYAHGLRITDNTISGNSSEVGGGGLFLSTSNNVIVSDNTLTGNSSGDYGGGLVLSVSDNAIVSNNTISDNSASSSGGGIWTVDSADLTLTANTVSGNSTDFDGGGVRMRDNYNARFLGNMIRGNSAARHGGGIYLGGQHVGVRVSLVGDRIIDSIGDGIYVDGYYNGVVVSEDPEDPTWVLANEGYEIFNNNPAHPSSAPSGDVDGRYVWWGTMDVFEIEDGIYDQSDDPSKGIVFYDPWAVPEPATLALLALGGLALIRRRKR